jgi:hypothetical protein
MEYHRNSGLSKREWTLDKLADKIKQTESSLTCIKILEEAFSLYGVVGSKDVQLMRDALLKSREETARIREATAIKQTLEIYCDHDELPTVNEVLERIGRKH